MGAGVGGFFRGVKKKSGAVFFLVIRPDFSAYVMGETGAGSLQDYLDHDQVLGAPGWPDRLYAGLDLMEPSQGISAIVNHYVGAQSALVSACA